MLPDLIEARANEILEDNLEAVIKIPLQDALKAENIQQYDYMTPYVEDLQNVIDMDVIAKPDIHIGADAMGGSGLAYYAAIKERYGLQRPKHLLFPLFHDTLKIP